VVSLGIPQKSVNLNQELSLEKFVALYDVHFGYERKGGHKSPLHDSKAIGATLEFMKDFRPDHIILGGDILDCSCISHHNHGKPGAVEGMKLIEDAKGLREALLDPIEALKPKTLTYIIGNHEDWLTDLSNQIPALEGMVDVKTVLGLKDSWKIVPLGEVHKLGKLKFIHGDQVKGGEYPAKWATVAYESNVRFGHYHTMQTYSKTAAFDSAGHTGICVPCLCKKNPLYGGGAPNKWMEGFLYGYVREGGMFNDYVAIINDGVCTINGVTYKG